MLGRVIYFGVKEGGIFNDIFIDFMNFFCCKVMLSLFRICFIFLLLGMVGLFKVGFLVFCRIRFLFSWLLLLMEFVYCKWVLNLYFVFSMVKVEVVVSILSEEVGIKFCWELYCVIFLLLDIFIMLIFIFVCFKVGFLLKVLIVCCKLDCD